MPKLTDASIRRMRNPARRVDLSDDAVPGLALRVTPTGVRTWSLLCRVRGAGRQRRITLGRFPALGVREAHAEALRLLELAARGVDPARQPEPEPEVLTVAALCERFVRGHAHPNTRKGRDIERVLRVHVLPRWGSRAVADVRRSDARQLLEEVLQPDGTGPRRRGGPAAAAEVRKWAQLMFNWAIGQELVEVNPFDHVRPPRRAVARDRALTMNEARAVWAAAGRLEYPLGPMYQLLILTGCRLREIAHARWGWVDGEERLLVVPADRYKSARAHVVPLSDLAMQVVTSIPRWSGGDHLFSTTGGRLPVGGFSKARVQLDRAVGDGVAQPWVVHDIRRTVRTHLSRLGVEPVVAEMVIGHSLRGVAAVYDRYSYLPERRAALELWAAEVTACQGAGPHAGAHGGAGREAPDT